MENLIKNNEKIFICDVDIEKYKDELANLEEKKAIIKNKIFKKYNNIININFDFLNGIDDVFNWDTGAVFFRDYEWQKIKNNKLKTLFNKIKEGSYIYSLPINNGIILRGSNIYYYFFCYVKQNQKITSKNIQIWFDNCKTFFQEIESALYNYKINDNNDIKLLLGLIDNLRNIILLMLNCNLIINYNDTEILYINNNNNNMHECMRLVDFYQNLMNKLLFIRPIDNNIINLIKALLNSTRNIFIKTINELLEKNNEFLFDRGINRLREMDHYLENYITCEYAIKESEKSIDEKEINLISILYGGLELPFIIKNSRFINKKINIGLLMQNIGNYLQKQENKNISSSNLKIIGEIDKNKSTLIIDDNLMSGVTMQLALNELKNNDFKNIDGILALRHPCLNRIPQLRFFNTYLNLSLVDKYIYGLLTTTPLTKIKDNTNYNGLFVNELNIYSTQTETFLKALYINNSFTKESEVDIFFGFSTGK